MEYVIDHMLLAWGRRNGRLPPEASDAEHDDDVPEMVHHMRRKSYYVRRPDEEDSPYRAPNLRN